MAIEFSGVIIALREKNYEVSFLLDFYGDILTDKQKQVIELYYDEDLSLAEIAEHSEITRQGVRDCIKRGEAVLFEMEEKLGLAKRFEEMKAQFSQILNAAKQIDDYNTKYCASRVINENAKLIINTMQTLIDDDSSIEGLI
jgi:predicted DNA-binding protein YlxM (UPF0122 family)